MIRKPRLEVLPHPLFKLQAQIAAFLIKSFLFYSRLFSPSWSSDRGHAFTIEIQINALGPTQKVTEHGVSCQLRVTYRRINHFVLQANEISPLLKLGVVRVEGPEDSVAADNFEKDNQDLLSYNCGKALWRQNIGVHRYIRRGPRESCLSTVFRQRR